MRALVGSATAPAVTTTLIILAIVAGATFLTYEGKINGDAFVALASAIVGGVLVKAGVSSASPES